MGIFSRIVGALAGGAGKVGAAVSGLRAALANMTMLKSGARRLRHRHDRVVRQDGEGRRRRHQAGGRRFLPDLRHSRPGEERNVSRVYNLAKRDIAGFESYARDVARLFGEDAPMLEAILDGLFEIAKGRRRRA
jgi:DnaJ like chaperone protein